MIGIDASVCVKWFKSGERYDTEAQDLRQRLERQEVEAAANEILSLEIVRGLKSVQARQPALGPSDAEIDSVFRAMEGMFQAGILQAGPARHRRRTAGARARPIAAAPSEG